MRRGSSATGRSPAPVPATSRSPTSSGRWPQSPDGAAGAGAVRGRRRPGPARRGGGGGTADRPLPRDHRHPPLRPPRLAGAGAGRAPGHRLRRPRPRPVRPRPDGGGLWIPVAGRRSGAGRRRRDRGGALPPRRPLDGRAHGGGLRARASRAADRPGPDRSDLQRRDRAGVGGLLGRPGGGAGERRGRGLRRLHRPRAGDRPGLARLGARLHPHPNRTAPPPRGAGRGAARGPALAPLRVTGATGGAADAGLGRRQPRRGRPGPSLRHRGRLRGPSPAGPVDQRGGGGVAPGLAGRQALAAISCLLRRLFIFVAMNFPSEGTLRRAVAFVAALGVGVATYITIAESGGGAPTCLAGGSGCTTVANSSYSEILGINVAILGIVGYAILLGTAFFANDAARLLGFATALGGFGFSI